MNQKIKQSVEDLKHIREMMEQSNKFLSLSGLSGVVAGLIALIGAFIAYKIMHHFRINALGYTLKGIASAKVEQLEIQLLLLSVAVLIMALGFGLFFTYLKAKKNGLPLYNHASSKVVKALFVPLVFGGLFTIILGKYELFQLAGAATLIFYGMSLLNASQFLNIEIKYLAISEMILGVLAGLFLDQVLIFWALGFGILHILYGSIMYFKYDRKG